jgi:hypothetical protein
MGKFTNQFNAGKFPSRAFDANKWITSNLRKLGTAKASPQPGLLQFFHYDPKLAAKLPYYDTLPLVLPIEMYGESFLGVNFHYLPLNLRVRLLDALLVLTEDKAITPTARIQASYGILVSAARFGAFVPCVKKYLYSHIHGGMLTIEPEGWEAAINMPVTSFQKAGNSKVWADSRRKI